MSQFFNLESFFQIFESEETQLKVSFVNLLNHNNNDESNNNNSTADGELNDLVSLIENILPLLEDSQKEGYLFDFSLKDGINEQFDILRFSEDEILNIELKRCLPEGGLVDILNQLKRHHYILSSLNKHVVTCTYVTSEETLYLFRGYPSNNLEKICINKLVDLISKNYILDNLLISANLTHLIISPYSEPNRFKDHQYFLTSEQVEAVNKTLSSDKHKISITGGPGTGKSLVLFDLAKKYNEQGKRALIVFCAPMTTFEESNIRETLNINFIHIKNLKKSIIEQSEVILIDESQRLWRSQYDKLINLDNKIIVFSTDHNQTLHSAEKTLNVEQKLKENNKVDVVKLKYKIRNDRALSSFIQKFLNLRANKVQPYEYKNVNVVYFDNKESAQNYMEMKTKLEGYVSIELTPYRTKSTNQLYRDMIYANSKPVHETIGREYDNVMVPIDKHFYYNQNAMLSSNYANHYPYHESDSIFQALTRTRSQLTLIVIENPKVYEIVQKILTWKKDRSTKDN